MTSIPRLIGNVRPDFDAIGDTTQLQRLVGALLTFGLLVAVLMLVVSAVSWGIASASGSWHAASRARAGLLVAVGGASLTGGALALLNWLLDVGASL